LQQVGQKTEPITFPLTERVIPALQTR
jgi:hypothetical protein